MIVTDQRSRIAVRLRELSLWQRETILSSPNAMRALVAGQTELPVVGAEYLEFSDKYTFHGAILLEPAQANTIYIHPAILRKDRELFTIATELAIIHTQLRNRTPATAVLATDDYAYMRSFLADIGCVVSYQENGFLHYRLAQNWKPRLSNITVEF